MAIEIVDFPPKNVIFHSYVSLPEGKHIEHMGSSIAKWITGGYCNSKMPPDRILYDDNWNGGNIMIIGMVGSTTA